MHTSSRRCPQTCEHHFPNNKVHNQECMHASTSTNAHTKCTGKTACEHSQMPTHHKPHAEREGGREREREVDICIHIVAENSQIRVQLRYKCKPTHTQEKTQSQFVQVFNTCDFQLVDQYKKKTPFDLACHLTFDLCHLAKCTYKLHGKWR